MKIEELSQRTLDIRLIRACKKGDLNRVKEALKNGANINSRNSSPLIYASENGHLEVVKYLIENGAFIHNDALIDASYNGHLEVVKYLVENGADIHAKANDSRAEKDDAVKLANGKGYLDIVKYLISKMDSKYVIENLPNYVKYIPDTVFSLTGKFISED